MITILDDATDVARAQARHREKGCSDTRVGAIACDPYLGTIWRDAVRFCDGSVGLHNRHIGHPGCLVMPMIGNDVVLIRVFRHPTREWSWEFPGGAVGDDKPHMAAMQELREEIGAECNKLTYIGIAHPYPSFSDATTHLYLALIDGFGKPQTEENIAEIKEVSLGELSLMVVSGEITDAATLSCIMQAKFRGLI
jgi:ADP-ribose diphosphatase